jgi:hypothetical protein
LRFSRFQGSWFFDSISRSVCRAGFEATCDKDSLSQKRLGPHPRDRSIVTPARDLPQPASEVPGFRVFLESRCLCFAAVGIRRMMTGAGEGRHAYLSCTIAPSLKSLWTIATSRSHRSFICSLSFCCASWLLTSMLVESEGESSAAAPCSCILKEKPTRDVLAPARAGKGRRDLIEGRGGARKPDTPAMQASRRAHLRIILPRRLCCDRDQLGFSDASSLAKRLAQMSRSAALMRWYGPPRCSACECADQRLGHTQSPTPFHTVLEYQL